MAIARRPARSTAIIAGTFCILDARGKIERAAAPSGREFWAAGRGSWKLPDREKLSRAWATHYA